MLSNNLSTEELQAMDAAHHLHPFTSRKEINAAGARVLSRADGVYVYDNDGQPFLDAMAGLWCVNIGYGRDELADAAHRQMKELPYYNTFFQCTHPPAVLLAARLAELAPGSINHAFFAGSGSEANDTNIRLVRHYWACQGKPEKSVIISRKNAYHGSSMGSGSLGGMKPMHAQGGLPIPGIGHIDQPYWYGEGGEQSAEEFGLERAKALETEIDRLGEANVAAFIAEPIQGAGGVIVPPSTYWPEIMRICKERDILFIADEVITGFGRTGEWFASQALGLTPDIITVAKGLSSGYLPIGASLVSDAIVEVLTEHGGDFNHGYTYSAHPTAAAVALENLRILDEEGIVTGVKEKIGPYFSEKWASLNDHPLVGEARNFGLMAALELTPNKATRAKFAGDGGDAGGICRSACLEQQLIMRAVGDTMIVSPPLVISEAEVDLLIERARIALDQTLETLKAEGKYQAA